VLSGPRKGGPLSTSPTSHVQHIIYIILNSRCYTGVRAPKLSHRSSCTKEPFRNGLDGLPGRWTSEGLQGGLLGLRPVQGGFKRTSIFVCARLLMAHRHPASCKRQLRSFAWTQRKGGSRRGTCKKQNFQGGRTILLIVKPH